MSQDFGQEERVREREGAVRPLFFFASRHMLSPFPPHLGYIRSLACETKDYCQFLLALIPVVSCYYYSHNSVVCFQSLFDLVLLLSLCCCFNYYCIRS